jgi:ABC-type branched-subunit amino acid transport system ATPase component
MRKGVVPTSIAYLFGSEKGGRITSSMGGSGSEGLAALIRDVLPSAGQTLKVQNVSVTFGGVKALDDVSLDVGKGKTVALIGPNGSGKTTMLNVLSGFVTCDSQPRIELGTVDIGSLTPSQRMRAGFGRTFQHAELFEELTIREMLTVVARQGTKARKLASKGLISSQAVAERIISGLGLQGAANSRPSLLPFGVQKVADIARALAGGAGFLAMDEPFSGLDTEECAKLRSILLELKSAGVTVLIIDHAVHEIEEVADEVVVLDFGCVIARGTPQDVFKDPRVRDAYFGPSEDVQVAANV